jgi:hypothetical protein
MVSSTRERGLRDCHDPISHTRDERCRDDNDIDVKSRGAMRTRVVARIWASSVVPLMPLSKNGRGTDQSHGMAGDMTDHQ